MAISAFRSDRYHPRVKAQQGFTLIEIVIALAIVAIGVLSVAEAMIQHTQVAGSLEKRVMAAWVASNQIALLTHDSKINRIKEGSTSEVVEMGGHKWRAQSKIRKTDVERVFLLTVTVKDESRRQEPAYAAMTTAISDAF
jgi:general secretion pathway protein I